MRVDVALNCRLATRDDALLLWRWANDLETRRNSFAKRTISHAEHRAWLARRLASPATRIWIFGDAEGPIGQVRCEVEGDAAELHISVAPERRRRGFGRAMLSQAVGLIHDLQGPRAKIRASVLEINARSLALFKACGFESIGDAESPERERAIILEWTGAPGRRAQNAR